VSEHNFLFQAFVYLAAAVVAVPVAQRLGLGSVLGYLLAGVAIGPFGLALLGTGGQDVMHVAEFGVVLMLFVIGLELQPVLLWQLRGPIVGLGGLQVSLTSVLVAALAVAAGLQWREALAVGMTLSLSSTAIVLQTLNEKGLLKTAGGQGSFAILLFQDIAVIPMLALFPLLALPGGPGGAAQDPRFSYGDGVAGGISGHASRRGVGDPAFRRCLRKTGRRLSQARLLLDAHRCPAPGSGRLCRRGQVRDRARRSSAGSVLG
jgi:hypothetical protein